MNNTKRKVYFNEYNVLMDRVAYLPIASGLLSAYACSIEEIRSNYEFMPFLFIRKNVKELVNSYRNPDVAAFSVSMWNEQISLAVAREVKQKFSDCLIVFGGPQVPHEAKGYFDKYNFIDVSVRGDGEHVFGEVLKRALISQDFSGIDNISWKDKKSGIYVKNETGLSYSEDLDNLPSPYLEGIFEYLFEDNTTKMRFQTIIETNRGCPFSCTYCVWGKGGMNKRIRYFSMDRIRREMEWAAMHKIAYVFNADANFGINERDLDIAGFLVENKNKFGYPEKFRTCFTKNSDKMILDLAKTLVSNKLEKGVTLSFQSLDKDVLLNIKRQNIKISTYKNLLFEFNRQEVPVYTELILGLPGETPDTWKKGVEEVIASGLKGQLFVYPCEIYPNTEMDLDEYKKKFGIVSKRVKLTETHGSIRTDREVQEFQDIIVGTASMPVEQWRRMMVFSWMIITLYGLKSAFFILLYLFHRLNVKFTDITEYICERSHCAKTGVLADEIKSYDAHLDLMLQGEGKCVVLPSYGDVYWDMEEASFLRISEKTDDFYKDLKCLIVNYLKGKNISFNGGELTQVFKYQALCMPRHDIKIEDEYLFDKNLPEFFDSCLVSTPVSIVSEGQLLKIFRRKYLNKKDFAREIIIWGRKSNNILDRTQWTPKK